MSVLGSHTTSDYIDFDRASNVAHNLLKDEKKSILGLYILLSINTGLRSGDIRNLRWIDLTGQDLVLVEQKTCKRRVIKLNDTIKSALSKFNTESEYIFVSQKGTVYSVQQLNKLLKSIFSRESKSMNISTHSLRKSFGRRVFEKNNETEKSLIILSHVMNHQNISTTKRYLGLTDNEIGEIYLNL